MVVDFPKTAQHSVHRTGGTLRSARFQAGFVA